jgi:hypothetical protein
MEEKTELKIKVQFIVQQGNETIKDAVLCKDLDGKDFVLSEFGKGISNALYRTLTRQQGDIIELKKFLETLHDSDGKEIEIKEEYVHLITDYVDTNYSIMISDEVHKIFDEAKEMN